VKNSLYPYVGRENTLNTLLDELRRYKEEQGLSTKELASKLDVPYKTVQSWLTKGKSHYDPSPANRNTIKKLLHPGTQPVQGRITAHSKGEESSAGSKDSVEDIHMTSAITPIRGKTVRDPIQMDIELTPLEVRVIDTHAFQRLRHIKQLGTASFVFPGATHTRFEHSLGTLAAAQVMINAINCNPETQLTVEGDVEKLVRMCALLHDITHIPFGHILEDEGFLYTRHDKSPDENPRWDLFLGPSSEIGQILGENFRKEVFTYLTTPQNQTSNLEHPYVIDIVGNTVCADLIDYLARDTTYAGLKETFDPRFLKNLLIASYDNPDSKRKTYKKRLVLSLLKQNMVRRDVISEVMHLLRLRYSLAEKVYYHHAKVVASAMIIEAMQAALIAKPSDFDEENLCKMRFGDDELLTKLRNSGVPIAVKLVDKLSTRAFYKPVYMLTYSAPSTEDTHLDKKLAIIRGFRDNHRKRFESERMLEKWNGLPEGSVIIYCPTEKMNLKEIETLCLWRDGQIIPLVEIPGGKLASEASGINAAHLELWKLYVFLERGLSGEREIMHNLASDCYHAFHLSNCIEEFVVVDKLPLERYIEKWAETYPDLQVTVSEKNQLVGSRSIYKERVMEAPPSYSDLEADLRDIRKKG